MIIILRGHIIKKRERESDPWWWGSRTFLLGEFVQTDRAHRECGGMQSVSSRLYQAVALFHITFRSQPLFLNKQHSPIYSFLCFVTSAHLSNLPCALSIATRLNYLYVPMWEWEGRRRRTEEATSTWLEHYFYVYKKVHSTLPPKERLLLVLEKASTPALCLLIPCTRYRQANQTCSPSSKCQLRWFDAWLAEGSAKTQIWDVGGNLTFTPPGRTISAHNTGVLYYFPTNMPCTGLLKLQHPRVGQMGAFTSSHTSTASSF